ncbi:MAG TPA: ATP-binding protein [Thermoanaerobaculia bacterium]|nr:ATP-binding protein [Thermoanaerobaculia bacterium]
MLRTLRGRLIALVAALLAVTIGSVATISLRVAHLEIRRVELRGKAAPRDNSLGDHYRTHGGWAGVGPLLDRIARDEGSDALLFDAQRRLIASTAGGSAELREDGTLVYQAAGVKKLLRGPHIVINDQSGKTTGFLFLLPRHEDAPPATKRLDRAFLWIFLGAALFGIVMAVGIARWTTVPIERLTAATRRMEAGDLAVRVEPAGGAELEELARGFNAMAAAVARTEELRKRMVTDVAHELRAPLTNIRCELESMQDGLIAPTPERIESLHQETMHLATLVDDLQDLALADAGRLVIDPQPVAIAALVRRVVGARDIEVAGDESILVLADAKRAVQILTNLVDNALTHMQQPGTVRIEWERSGDEVIIKVMDTGVGIPDEELPRVFERFYRVDPSRSRATGGAGLGLSIVQQLVAAHGGRVWAESAPGKGSTFTFTLPASS